MIRWFFLGFLGVCLVAPQAQGGWLSDKLQQAVEKLGERAVDDAADGAYRSGKKGAKEVLGDDGDDASRSRPQGRSDADPPMASSPAPSAAVPPAPSPSLGTRPARQGSGPAVALRGDLHFSADLLMVDSEAPDRQMRGRAYVDGERVRWEMTDPEGQRVATLVDGQARKLTMLMVEPKTFFEYPLSGDMGQEDPRAMLSGKVCDGYRTSEDRGGTKVDGRAARHWTCIDPEDPDSAATVDVWFDEKLSIPVRSEDSDGNRFEMQNLKEGRPPARLFRVPPGYTRMNLFGGGSAGREAVHPYAPKVEPVPGSEGSVGAMILTNTVVPEAGAVGIPCYPGAQVFQAMSRSMIEGGTNHILVLFSEDVPERVLAFYRMKLSGWKEEKMMGVGDPVFHKGTGTLDLFSVEGQSTPSVAVETITESMKFDVMPTARTKITLGYPPGS